MMLDAAWLINYASSYANGVLGMVWVERESISLLTIRLQWLFNYAGSYVNKLCVMLGAAWLIIYASTCLWSVQ